ncbi:deoxyguanosinetriphosphate triphosphohydrolase [Aestuariispira ectoiniformans]|uniref:deoxyguanosinetriphosphate triphosphohydrolase n=1 Tax=Aestuariispira ectoiniformans TaxID=2775080 RepID=UPI00223C0985|nr:deoxyguanosinetriphosphate triphosphohydrolase [Aestuariispira ectoiniformans]
MKNTLGPYATRWQDSRGRLHPETASETRTPFQRDRDRIIHCTAFRRLMHKTQVFISPEGDHFRTRLTHSLEVAQIARAMARTLGVDEDLTEAVALAHDLGHTPFGHTGEDALDDVTRPFGGFDHNDQALRVLVLLENRYVGFHGLNLSWETLEGVVKHNGPLLKAGEDESDLPTTIATYNRQHDLDLHTFAGMEAQVAAIADDVAYNHHDMDDGLRAGLFTIDEVSDEVPHVGQTFADIRKAHPNLAGEVLISEAVRRLIGEMVEDVVSESKQRLVASAPKDANEVRHLDRPMVAFSDGMREKERGLKAFLFRHMYRAPIVNAERERAFKIVCDMFRHYLKNPDLLPPEWRSYCDEPFSRNSARIVTDYIAGMTDRFALNEAERLFGKS